MGTTTSHDSATRPAHQPPGMHTVTPYICVREAARAIDWYVGVFAATETGERFVGPDGRVGHAELRIGDSLLMLAEAHPEIDVVAPEEASGATYSLSVYVPDVDATVAEAAQRGARVDREPRDAPYGARAGVVRDPFGVRWMVGTHQREVSTDDLRAAADRYTREG